MCLKSTFLYSESEITSREIEREKKINIKLNVKKNIKRNFYSKKTYDIGRFLIDFLLLLINGDE